MSSGEISNTKTTHNDIGGLFDPHFGSLTDFKECLSCFNTRKSC